MFVSGGEGVLESPFGSIAFSAGDYLVIPRGILHRYRFTSAERLLLVIESAGICSHAEALPQRVWAIDRGEPVLRARHARARKSSRRTMKKASSRWW